MHIALLTLDLFIPHSQSLKDKRQVLKSLKDRVHNQFNVSIAEVDHHDKWQVACLGFVMIGVEQPYMDSVLENVVSFIEAHYPQADITGRRVEYI